MEHRPDFGDGVQAQLRERRLVSVFGRLDDAAVTRLAAELWTLDSLGDEPVTLYVSISGGSVEAAGALLDVLDVVGVEVRASCVGQVCGPALAVLAGASLREAAPSTRFVLRDETVSLSGSFGDLQRAVADHHARRHDLLGRLAASTKGRRSLGDVLVDFERGRSLTAEESLAYGLVDRVVPVRRDVVQPPRPPRPLGFQPDRWR